MTVYVLHLDSPMRHARHYCGYAKDLVARLTHHKNGTGARMLAVAKERAIGFILVRVWPDEGRGFERKLKNTKNISRYCPMCSRRARRYQTKDKQGS